ncbi:acetate/propionate family kinase [Frankia sp. QA3]|uniref:acetate/propionate family kinase n=1 Tax=Frankia sp. QA3 TaxID=710111 RepID=UPI000269CBEC|nr:acetate kinase [Frankia sp. QA3]
MTGSTVNVLVVNAGSASLKLRLIGPDDTLLAARDLAAPAGRADPAELDAALGELAGAGNGEPGAVGHRIVHGGTEFTRPVRVDAQVADRLRALTALAPLHQPAALDALDAVRAALPEVAQVACFDTAFHSRLPAAAMTYALPARWRERYGIRRYGFHGLSHAHASRRAARLTGARRIVTCHLGSGASLAAVLDGVGVDTTMGFTPLEGLVMGTRSGSVDPGALLWLQTEAGVGAAELTEGLFRSAGLLGLAGTADMRAVEAGAAGGDPACVLALDVYLHRLRAQIAAMTAALGGLDALVFTGGVGEGSAAVRAGAAAGLGYLGVAVDPARNASPADGTVDREIGAPGAAVRTLVLAAREDLEIASGVRSLLAGGAG